MSGDKFIKGAIKHPGALRAEALREHLIKGTQKLSKADLAHLKAHAEEVGDEHLMRQVNLAITLAKF